MSQTFFSFSSFRLGVRLQNREKRWGKAVHTGEKHPQILFTFFLFSFFTNTKTESRRLFHYLEIENERKTLEISPSFSMLNFHFHTRQKFAFHDTHKFKAGSTKTLAEGLVAIMRCAHRATWDETIERKIAMQTFTVDDGFLYFLVFQRWFFTRANVDMLFRACVTLSLLATLKMCMENLHKCAFSWSMKLPFFSGNSRLCASESSSAFHRCSCIYWFSIIKGSSYSGSHRTKPFSSFRKQRKNNPFRVFQSHESIKRNLFPLTVTKNWSQQRRSRQHKKNDFEKNVKNILRARRIRKTQHEKQVKNHPPTNKLPVNLIEA